jgi:hypothetical protein
MAQAIEIVGVRIFAQTTRCAHSCRYCLIEGKKHTNLPFSRFAGVVERFAAWKNDRSGSPLSILAGYGDSYELEVEPLKNLFVLLKKIGTHEEAQDGIKLGGLKWRTEADMREWLRQRRDEAGLKIVHASLAGYGSVHDGWNGRKGDFEFLLQTMKSAAELGLEVRQRLFVVNSTLPLFERLLAALDSLPGQPYRYLSTFVHHGLATRYEEERITEATRDRLPSFITSIAQRDGDSWLSEREWLSEKRDELAAERPERLFLDLELTEANIASWEEMPCDEIVDLLAKQARRSLQPSRAELYDRYADHANQRVYASLGELIHKWRGLHKLRSLETSRGDHLEGSSVAT